MEYRRTERLFGICGIYICVTFINRVESVGEEELEKTNYDMLRKRGIQ